MKRKITFYILDATCTHPCIYTSSVDSAHLVSHQSVNAYSYYAITRFVSDTSNSDGNDNYPVSFRLFAVSFITTMQLHTAFLLFHSESIANRYRIPIRLI